MLINKPKMRQASRISKLLNSGLARPLVAMQMRKQVAKKANPKHYPAPYAIIDHWQKNFSSEPEFLEKEAESVAQLSTNKTTKNLVRVFLLQDELKSLS